MSTKLHEQSTGIFMSTFNQTETYTNLLIKITEIISVITCSWATCWLAGCVFFFGARIWNAVTIFGSCGRHFSRLGCFLNVFGLKSVLEIYFPCIVRLLTMLTHSCRFAAQ